MRLTDRALVVTSIENHQKIHLFKIIKILIKFKIFKYHRIGKFIIIIGFRKLDFLSEEKYYFAIQEYTPQLFKL